MRRVLQQTFAEAGRCGCCIKVPYCGGQSKSCCQSPQQHPRAIEGRYGNRWAAQHGFSAAPIPLSWILRQQHLFSRSWKTTAHTQLWALSCPPQDRSLFWHHSFHSCFASYFARSIFFIIIIITIILSPIPLRLFFRSLSQAVFNSLELFRIYMIILRSANRKQSHVVLGIFLTCCKKCISPLWSYRQSQLHRQMMSDSPCPSSQRKFVQELETEPLCYKSQSQKQKSVLLQILLIDIISLHGGLFWVTGMGLKYFHVGFHPASLRWTHYNEFSNAFWFGFVFLLLTTQIHDREQ